MSEPGPHNKLIAKAAKEVLGPMGLVRKGQSRTWFDDRGWWVGVVEFQPSGFSKGSYLNVGVSWLWYRNADVSFDAGPYRIAGSYVDYIDDAQFLPAAHVLAERAAKEILQLRGQFATLVGTAKYYRGLCADSKNPWVRTTGAIVLRLVDEVAESQRLLRSIVTDYSNDEIGWVRNCARDAQQLLDLSNNRAAFEAEVLDRIEFRRNALKLPSKTIELK